MKQKIQEKFKSLFGEEGILYASAGRINLIGEHTDYNGGYVFPGAINFGIMAAIKPNGTDTVRLFAINRDEYVEFVACRKIASRSSTGPVTFSASAGKSSSAAAR